MTALVVFCLILMAVSIVVLVSIAYILDDVAGFITGVMAGWICAMFIVLVVEYFNLA